MDEPGARIGRTSGVSTWRAGCGESCTSGSEGGPGKPTRREPSRAPRSDPTGRFYRSALYPLFRRINTYPLRWTMKKYKKLRTWQKSMQAMGDAAALRPRSFAHWAWVKPAAR